MYKVILNIIKKVFDWMANFDLSNPKSVPCNPNCIAEGYNLKGTNDI